LADIEKDQLVLVTVLTLSYNSPDLYAAIDSVLKQDYKRIQYVLVDDGTEEFSEKSVCTYIEEFRTSNIEDYIIVSNPENYGTVRSTNIGLLRAEGEYIFNLAGDDVFTDSSVISKWVSAFQQSGALVMTAYRNVYDVSMKYYLGRMPTVNQVNKIRTLVPAELFEEVARGNFIFGCCTAFSRRCLEQYGYYDERYKLIEDHSKILRLLRQGVAIAFFDQSVIQYRGNGSSSGECYNKVYEHDVDLIYQYEIMPYTKNKKCIQKAHRKWKTRQQSARDLSVKLQRLGTCSFCAFFLKLGFYGRYPIESIRGLLANPAKLKKMFHRI